MKRFAKKAVGLFVCVIVLAIMLTFVGVTLVFAEEAESYDRKTTTVKKGTPEISGIEDDVWKQTEDNLIDRMKKDRSPGLSDEAMEPPASGRFKLLYDEENLYILVVVADKTEYMELEDAAPNTQDAVEFQLNPLNTEDTIYTENHMKFIITRAGRLSSGWEDTRTKLGLNDSEIELLKDNNVIKGEITDGDGSYTIEISIPIKSLFPEFKAEANYEFGIDIQIDDSANGEEGCDYCLGWNDYENLAFADPQKLGSAKLTSEAVISQPAQTEDDNPTEGTEVPNATTARPRPKTSAPVATEPAGDGISTTVIIIIISAVVVLGGGGVAAYLLMKKKK